jgi:hypothetical protein
MGWCGGMVEAESGWNEELPEQNCRRGGAEKNLKI